VIAEVAFTPPKIKPRSPPSIPYLNGHPLIVVVGEQAHTVVARLRVVAAEAGIRCLDFGPNAFIGAPKYSRIIRDAAQAAGQPALHVPLPDATKQWIELADLVVIAPPDTGNRVWLIPKDGCAFSVHLPDYGSDLCGAVTELLLAGLIRLTSTHLARPGLLFRAADIDPIITIMGRGLVTPPPPRRPTHFASAAVH
jgi:hypothetical protein